MKVNIIYWSGTGNTEAMAKLIEEGAQSTGADVSLLTIPQEDSALDCDVLVLGCPAMGAEVLEETVVEPYIASIEGKISGKKLALFGSYEWGDGEWMTDWTDRMEKAGAVIAAESLIVNDAPSGDDVQKCKDFGESVAR